MQASSVLTHAAVPLPRRPQRALAGSKSLAAMLPTILTSGVITLVITAILRLVWVGFNNDFFAAWMEAWLATWAIAFPLAYLSKPLVYQVATSLSKPVGNTLPADYQAGLGLSHVSQVAETVTAQNQLQRQARPYIHRYY